MWDLKDLLGQSVSIQIVDKASGSGQASASLITVI